MSSAAVVLILCLMVVPPAMLPVVFVIQFYRALRMRDDQTLRPRQKSAREIDNDLMEEFTRRREVRNGGS